MHWSLDQVRGLDEDEFDELCAWLKDRNDRRSGDDSIDLDKVIDKTREEATSGSE